MFQWLRKNSNLKIIILTFSISTAVYLIMIMGTIPHIERSVGGMKIFDLSPMGYSHDYTVTLMGMMSEEIKNYYKYFQIPLDFIYPLAIGLFSLFSLAFMNNRVGFWGWFYIFPIFGCVFDYLENIFVFFILSGYQNKMIIQFSSLSTIIKSISSTISYSLLLIIFLIFLVKYKVVIKK